jgi:hypothetical protein
LFVVYSEDENLLPSNKEVVINWYHNILHNSKDANISDSDIFVSKGYIASDKINGVSVNSVLNKDGNLVLRIRRNDNGIKFAVVHLLSPNLRWLWYSKYNEEYNISNGSSCLNHFCFAITWQRMSERGGIGSGEFNGSNVKVIEINSTIRGVKFFR